MSTGTGSSMAAAARRGGETPEDGVRVRALPALASTRRILFLGDSITYGGLYIEYLDAYLATRFPEQRVELINLGLPSETASGLSEPGHAEGAFPRPDVHERLQRAMEKVKPDLVVACYGMNDGIYYPLSEERFRRYREGMGRLVRQVRSAGARALLLTPPVFDPLPLRGKTLPAGRESYPGGTPYVGYDEVLTCYARWLVEQHRVGWPVFDVHGTMGRHLAARRLAAPGYVFAGDGVHANPFGHWLIAQAMLAGWRAPSDVDVAVLDLKANKSIRGDASEPGLQDGSVRFVWRTHRPLPMDPRWDPDSVALEKVCEHFNRWRLIVRNAPAPRYRLYSRDVLLDCFSRDDLAAGIDLLRYPDLDANQGANDLLGLIHQRQMLLRDAWLAEVGHCRPGVAAGLPVAEAQAQAEELGARIRELAAPVALTLRLEPVTGVGPEAFPGRRAGYHGFDRMDFTAAGRPVTIVAPRDAAPGRPWIWRTGPLGEHPEVGLALLERGFHVVSMETTGRYGGPRSMFEWNALYERLTRRHGLARKAALEAIGPGGLICYRWAAAHPDAVACIYGIDPVCDFRSWPAGKGKSPGDPDAWRALMQAYFFLTENDALAYPGNPVDNLESVARASIPILHLCREDERTVPYDENTGLLKERCEALGGSVQVIVTAGEGDAGAHEAIVEFILAHV